MKIEKAIDNEHTENLLDDNFRINELMCWRPGTENSPSESLDKFAGEQIDRVLQGFMASSSIGSHRRTGCARQR